MTEVESALAQLESALVQARSEYDKSMSVYDDGGLHVEYDSDYYEGQVIAYEHAVQILGGS